MKFLQKIIHFIFFIVAIAVFILLVEGCQHYLEEVGIFAKAASRVITKGDTVLIYPGPFSLWNLMGNLVLVIMIGISLWVLFSKSSKFSERCWSLWTSLICSICIVASFYNDKPCLIIDNKAIYYRKKHISWDQVSYADMYSTSVRSGKAGYRTIHNIVLYGNNNQRIIILRRVENWAMERTELLALITSKIIKKNMRVRLENSCNSLKKK